MAREKGQIITADVLRSILHYDPETGVFTWLVAPCKSVKAGDIARNVRTDGYGAIQFKNRLYKLHRLAWLYMTGEWPNSTIDHSNRNNGDNRWENLRLATREQQVANRKTANRTGYKGVEPRQRKDGSRRYRAVFYPGGGQRRHLGYFRTPEEAAEAYAKAAIARHGEFVCLAANRKDA